MEDTFFNHLDAFLNLKRHRLFTASVQATYFAILAEFYQQGFPEEISMTVRELGEKAGLKSSETVHVAKNILKNNGLIDFQTVGKQAKRTIFTLVCPNVWTNNLPNHPPNNSPNNLPNTESGFGLVSCTQNTAQDGGGGTLPPLPPTPPITPNPNIQSQSITTNQASLGSAEPGAGAQEDVEGLWEKIMGERLESPAKRFALKHYADTYGREIVKVALEECTHYGGKSFTYFEKCLTGLVTRLKGGEKEDERRSKTVERTDNAGKSRAEDGKGRFDDNEPNADWVYE